MIRYPGDDQAQVVTRRNSYFDRPIIQVNRKTSDESQVKITPWSYGHFNNNITICGKKLIRTWYHKLEAKFFTVIHEVINVKQCSKVRICLRSR